MSGCGFGLLENFYPYIIDTVIEASSEDSLRAIQKAVRKIARDTEMFTETLTLDLVAGKTSYQLNSIYDAKVLRVVTLTVNNVVLGNDKFSITSSGRILNLLEEPKEDVENGIVVDVTLLPNLDCLELDEYKMEEWAEAIIAESKFQLYSQPKKPWSDPVEAGYQKELYEGYIELIAQHRITQGQSGPTSINFGARI